MLIDFEKRAQLFGWRKFNRKLFSPISKRKGLTFLHFLPSHLKSSEVHFNCFLWDKGFNAFNQNFFWNRQITWDCAYHYDIHCKPVPGFKRQFIGIEGFDYVFFRKNFKNVQDLWIFCKARGNGYRYISDLARSQTTLKMWLKNIKSFIYYCVI